MVRGVVSRRNESTAGRYVFHARLISLSYRTRGRVARTQINHAARSRVVASLAINREVLSIITEDRALKNKIFMYSAIKIRANWAPLYSVLKPETSSLSPSAWSKGARLVSARHESSQIMHTRGRMSEVKGPIVKNQEILKDLKTSMEVRAVTVMVTS